MEPTNKIDTKKWSSIDIYLFSNGQQYSPPRKYHLRSEELQWWENTISYLGRTHYGSGHATIDIYTTDGIKINGPLELINGAAYVAVEPPDTFVNTGYEEYLLRASRSWDKRLILKSAINPDTTDPKPISADDTNSVENTLPKNGDNTASTIKSQLSKPRQLQQKKTITSSKQIQKKKPPGANNTTLKRICTETDKFVPCPRKSSLRNEVSNRKRSSPVPCNRNENQEQSICSKNAKSAKPKSSQDNKNYGVQPDTKSNRIESLQYSLLSHNDSTDLYLQGRKNRILSDTITDEDQTVVSLYYNKDRDIISMTSNPESDKIIDKSIYEQSRIRNYNLKDLNNNNSASVQQDTILQETEKKGKLEEVNIKKEVSGLIVNGIKTTKYDNEQTVFPVNDNISKDDIDKATQPKILLNENVAENKLDNGNPHSNNHLADKEATDEYIAYMNKGGLLLLKLRIKVKDCRTIINKNKINDTQVTSSIINLLKTEKTSQVDIDLKFSSELLKANNGKCIQDKSLQSVINNFYREDSDHIDSKRPKIIIVKCACQDYSKYDRERQNTLCGCNDEEENKTWPKSKLNEMVPSCQCYNDLYDTSKDTQNIILDEYATKGHRSSRPKHNGTRVSYLAQKFENADKVLSNNGKSSRNENFTPAEVTSRLNESSLKANTENPMNGNIDSTSKILCDKSIQTDWSNVILEARRHEDENYTFHLPSLYVLKQCKL